jgi:O-acetyl-ADP-ribose deacetylase (regulator of RNase III)
MRITVDDVVIECIQGDIAAQADVKAIVNAANAELRIGGGVAGAIHRAAGPGLEEEATPLGPIEPGEAVITGAHDLPNEFVIHCLGPVYGRDEPSDELLAQCYEVALELADDNGIESIAFPALSTGAFGYPIEEAAEIAIQTVLNHVENLSTVKLIRFVLFSAAALRVHERVLKELSRHSY